MSAAEDRLREAVVVADASLPKFIYARCSSPDVIAVLDALAAERTLSDELAEELETALDGWLPSDIDEPARAVLAKWRRARQGESRGN